MRSPSRVLITGGREVGGVESFAQGLAAGFEKAGVEAEVISPRQIWSRARQLRDCNTLKILSTTAVFAAPFSRRTICVAHGFPRADAQGWTNTFGIIGSFKCSEIFSTAKLVAVSHYTAAHLRSIFGVKVDAVIRNPVQSMFLETPEPSRERVYLTYVGRLIEAKHADLLLPAMCKLQAENPELKICVIGDGPLRTALQRSAEGNAAVEFTGNVDPATVRKYLSRTKVFVSGNEMEPLGIVYLEALAQGCNVAMPACGGGIEIAVDQIGKRIHLFPLSFDLADVTSVLRTALTAEGSPVPLDLYTERAVAEAYLRIDAQRCQRDGSLNSEKDRAVCASTRCV